MKKGISLVALSVSILIVFILASVISVSLIKNYNETQKIEFSNEIDMLQIAVNNYYKTNNYYPIKDQTVTISGDFNEDIRIQFEGETLYDNKYMFSVIDYEKINIKSLKYGIGNESNDKYVVSTTTGKVYYAKGLKLENKIYYNLSSEFSSLIDNNQFENFSKQGIIFDETIEDAKLIIKVSVPKEYQVDSVTFEQRNIEKSFEDSNYYVYKVNVDKVGTIIVEYRINNNQKIDKYLVSNI